MSDLACASCGRLVGGPKTKPGEGGRVCLTCYARTHLRPCVVCGEDRRPGFRNLDGTMTCRRCAARGRARQAMTAATEEIVPVLAMVEPDVPADVVRAAVERAAPYREARLRLAAGVTSDPSGVFAGSTRAPRVVERLVRELRAAGAGNVQPPRCADCGRPRSVEAWRDGERLCGSCGQRHQLVVCSHCREERPRFARDPDGRPVCGRCRHRDPRQFEECADCGERARVARRLADGRSLCPRCQMQRARAGSIPTAHGTCVDCGRQGFCMGGSLGEPRCPRCYPNRRAVCVACGQVRRVAAAWPTGPHCDRCRDDVLRAKGRCSGCGQWRRIDPRNTTGEVLCSMCAGLEPFSTCSACGAEDRLYARGHCARCHLTRRLDDLLANSRSDIACRLAPLRSMLLEGQDPASTIRWLAKPTISRLLGELTAGARPLTHAGLDAAGPSRVTDYLRQILVAARVLPARDEHLTRLEHWLAEQLEAIGADEDRHLIDRFATWHVLRRYRHRATRQGPTGSTAWGRRAITAAIQLLGWLREHDRSLTDATQADIDRWIAGGPAGRRNARTFLRWAARQRLAAATIAAPRRDLPGSDLPPGDLRRRVQTLLQDDTLGIVERAAGLLVALYAQPVTRLCRLTLDDVHVDGDAVSLRLGAVDIELAPMVGDVIRALAQQSLSGSRRGSNRWLFPGGRPGRPVSPAWLTTRLNAVGLHAAAIRNAALLDLAAEVPAPFLADLLGLHPGTAVRWMHAAGGEWAGYAATRLMEQAPGSPP